MKKILLHIDTSVSQEVFIALHLNDEVFSKKHPDDGSRSQALLPLITSLFGEHGLTPRDITEITVVTGPGSFTGIRVGLTVANTLAALLDIPVNRKKTLATPTYS